MNSPDLGAESSGNSALPRLDSLIIALAAGAVLGLILVAQGRMRDDGFTFPAHSPNDRSRFATIIALMDHGTYAIDEVIERKVNDKVQRTEWYTIDMVRRPDTEHYYSSKPPLVPTMLAGEYWLIKTLGGTVVEFVCPNKCEKDKRYPKAGDCSLCKTKLAESERVRFTFKDHPHLLVRTIVATANWVPFVAFLVLLARLLRRFEIGHWARAFTLATAGLGTYLSGFSVTLNNHTIAAFSAFFALYQILLVVGYGERSAWRFAVAGLFAAFTVCNELPAGLFGVAAFVILLRHAPRLTLAAFLPAAMVPLAAFFFTNYLVTGDLLPVYLHKEWYRYEGSYWSKPTGIDAIHEPWYLYLFHTTLGHHGVFSLSPVFVLCLMGVVQSLSRPYRAVAAGSGLNERAVAAGSGLNERLLGVLGNLSRPGGAGEQRGRDWVLWHTAILTVVLTVAIFAFYVGIPALKPFGLAPQRNYGGMCNGFRWSFWLIPFWLLFLPRALEGGMSNRGFRAIALIFLLFSGASALYATRNPWTRPWLHELLYQAGWLSY